jgi:two-component system, OmpR family, sensor kinase
MKLVTRAFVTYGLLLAMAGIGAVAAVWTSNQARLHIERMELASQSYQAHLRLSNDTYQLFKEFGDEMVTGDAVNRTREAKLIASMRGNISDVRAVISEEIRLVGSEEVAELTLLNDIERRLESLIDRYETGLLRFDRDSERADMRALARELDNEIDGEFNSLIQDALIGELQELEETKAETKQLMETYTLISIIIGLLSAIFGIAAMLLIIRDIKNPVQALASGAREMASGNWNHRVPTGFVSELNDVAIALNDAAQRASSREESAKVVKERLETEVAERTAELQQALDRLNREAEMRRQLLADVSHELRTPLTIIRGEAGVALRGGEKSPAEYREALAKAKEAAEHTASLVDDLLFVARQETGESRLDLQDGDMLSVVCNAMKRFEVSYSEDGFSLHFNSELDEAPARFDERRVSQVMMILLENAQLYGRSPVEVSLERTRTGYEVAVSDKGPGIAENEVESIFSRFFRGSNASERYGGGSGLGLPVARSIVEAHGGTLEYAGKVGEGARFVISLPFRAPMRVVA